MNRNTHYRRDRPWHHLAVLALSVGATAVVAITRDDDDEWYTV